MLSHEWPGLRDVSDAEVAAAIEKRRTLDLYVNLLREEEPGLRAGHSDRKGRFHDVFLPKTAAQIIAELVHAGRPVRPVSLACLQQAGLGRRHAGAVRLVEQARKLVDINALVGGKESRKKWRAIHTSGEKHERAFWFDPPPGFRWGVLVQIGG